MFRKKEQKEPSEKVKGKKKRVDEEPQYYKTETGLWALNYRIYKMSIKEKVCYTIISFVVGAFVGYVFYGGMMKDDLGNPTIYTHGLNTIIMLLTGLIFTKIFMPMQTESLKKERQEKLKRQFRDMLDAIATSLGSGRNVPDSIIVAYEDLGNQYEETAYIIQELGILRIGLINNLRLEDMLTDFGFRSGCDDIENFANVFEICYSRGGNIRDTVRNTCDIIGDKMAIVEDIETVVTSSKSELKLMLVLPVMMIMLMKGSSPDFANNFVTPAGLASTTIALCFVIAAYWIGNKILTIKV